MTLAKRRNVVYKILICFYEMFYRNFLSLNVLENRFFFILLLIILLLLLLLLLLLFILTTGEQSVDDLKKHQQSMKTTYSKLRMEEIDASLSPDLLRSIEQARDKGASSWLNAIPLKEQSLALNKQEFRDSLRLRYNLPLSDLPNHCACGDRMTVGHALSCKRGGFVAQRHDGIRELLTLHISRICKNVEVEPRLQPIDTERFDLRTTTTSPEARLDIKAGGV